MIKDQDQFYEQNHALLKNVMRDEGKKEKGR